MKNEVSVVNQSHARAGGNVIGGSLIYNHFHQGGIIAQLTAKLCQEMEEQKAVEQTASILACWDPRPAPDGIVGLEAKLAHANRANEIADALACKEEFNKLLVEWSLFGSAQEIFAIYLGKIEHEFKYNILPQIAQIDSVRFNDLVTSRIADPLVFHAGSTIICITHRTVMGMFYWLAERCFVRWHV